MNVALVTSDRRIVFATIAHDELFSLRERLTKYSKEELAEESVGMTILGPNGEYKVLVKPNSILFKPKPAQ